MRVVTRNVFYCDHCGRHRLTKSAIENHEPRCIYNPDRAVCGWHRDTPVVGHAGSLASWVAQAHGDVSLDELRRAADGCPACALAIVVQAKLTREEYDDLGFVYRDECDRFREQENREYAY